MAPEDTLFPMEGAPEGPNEPRSQPSRRVPRRVGAAQVDPAIARAADQLPRRIRLGTSSWNFPGWRGLVWDREWAEGTLSRGGLAAYATHPLLRCVGVDRTFYRPIDAATFREMADQVPEDFRFLVKAPESLVSRRPMHGEGRFLDVGFAAEHLVHPFLEGLGPKGGPLLFQFPPMGLRSERAATDTADEIERFLAALPRGPLYAVEVRDRLLLGAGWGDRLARAGAVHCYSVHPSMPSPLEQARAAPPRPGAPLVCRWMLHGGTTYEQAAERYHPFDRIVDPDPGAREEFAAMLERAASQERDCFLIANNKAEGSAPITLALLAEAILARQ